MKDELIAAYNKIEALEKERERWGNEFSAVCILKEQLAEALAKLDCAHKALNKAKHREWESSGGSEEYHLYCEILQNAHNQSQPSYARPDTTIVPENPHSYGYLKSQRAKAVNQDVLYQLGNGRVFNPDCSLCCELKAHGLVHASQTEKDSKA